jgi:hypothetical protein
LSASSAPCGSQTALMMKAQAVLDACGRDRIIEIGGLL